MLSNLLGDRLGHWARQFKKLPCDLKKKPGYLLLRVCARSFRYFMGKVWGDGERGWLNGLHAYAAITEWEANPSNALFR